MSVGQTRSHWNGSFTLVTLKAEIKVLAGLPSPHRLHLGVVGGWGSHGLGGIKFLAAAIPRTLLSCWLSTGDHHLHSFLATGSSPTWPFVCERQQGKESSRKTVNTSHVISHRNSIPSSLPHLSLCLVQNKLQALPTFEGGYANHGYQQVGTRGSP